MKEEVLELFYQESRLACIKQKTSVHCSARERAGVVRTVPRGRSQLCPQAEGCQQVSQNQKWTNHKG